MPQPVKLSDLIDAMEWQSDEGHSYFNVKTGKVATITDEEFSAADEHEPPDEFPEWQRENIRIAEEILESDDYLELPSKFEIHEYEIMERFCLSLPGDLGETMYSSIKGSGAFRRFKDDLRRHGIEKDWHKFRDEKIREIAIEWCERHGIPFINE